MEKKLKKVKKQKSFLYL